MSRATTRIEMDGGWGYRVELRALAVRVASGPDRNRRATFVHPVVRVGTSEDNDLVLTDSTVSRHHAELRLDEDGLSVRDLGSTNGTCVDQVPVKEARVPPGATIRVGDTHLEIREKTRSQQARVTDSGALGALIGSSPAMRELYAVLEAVAKTPATVQIQGESGTGKELVARTLHELSGRQGPLVVFDAGATDPQMIRADLFGHVKGAFTGADAPRDGAFRSAEGGTLFLDEVGELPLDLQPRLLRALESREVQPIGSDQRHRVDVRVVSATHRDLRSMVAAGTFREDLMHRLSVVPVRVPSLRERPADVPMLLSHFARELAPTCQFSPEAVEAMARCPWPGNVRALRNQVERLGALRAGQVVRVEDLDLPPATPPEDAAPPPVLVNLDGTVEPMPSFVDPERVKVEAAMARLRGNKSAVARELGIPLSTLKRRLKSYQKS